MACGVAGDAVAALATALADVGVRRCWLCARPAAERAVIDAALRTPGVRRKIVYERLRGIYGDDVTYSNLSHHRDYCLTRSR